MTTKFRHKPTEIIEAWQWLGQVEDEWPPWLYAYSHDGRGVGIEHTKQQLLIPTWEGIMIAKLNSWVVKGTHGELYPVKPEIFADTYEPVEP